jgi:uncharacterized protein (TIGR03118 family)
MKFIINKGVLLAALTVAACFFGCKKNYHTPSTVLNVTQVNLVADTLGLGAATIDNNLSNAWGLSASPTGIIWISANHKGVSTVYDNTGKTIRPPVTIPAAVAGQTGAPSGVIFNSTTDFGGAKFIFASEDGIVTAWSSGNSAVTVADRSSSNAVYKGLVMATDGGANFLYLTDFKGAKIDVLDKNFTYVSGKAFSDPGIPAGFAPFNIQNIQGMLYVTYAKQQGPDNMDDQKGPGNGFVDIFSPSGTFVKRFASQGALNSPWGITVAPKGFAGEVQTILVGNFGDGRVNVFDMEGNYKGQLQTGGQPLTIEGLWAIDFLKGNPSTAISSDPMYFTAGPSDESHGLFGYLKK